MFLREIKIVYYVNIYVVTHNSQNYKSIKYGY